MLGRLAAKGVEVAAPVVKKAIGGIGDAAEARQIACTKEALELKANKGTRAGLKSDVVDTAIADSPELRKAAGNDAKVAEVTGGIKSRAAAALKPIYEAAGPADEAVAKAVGNVDERIAVLKAGDVNQRAAAVKLAKLRDEFNDSFGPRESTSASELRAEQSAYQRNGYAKNIAGDPEVATNILAQREMSKAVGDALVEHVTGVPYEAAKKLAAQDPNSIAAKLFKANDQISAANKIEAGIADRAGKVQPPHGPMAVAKRVASHAVAPLFVGASHGPMAGLATAVGQEALHAAPAVLRAGASGIDSQLAKDWRRARALPTTRSSRPKARRSAPRWSPPSRQASPVPSRCKPQRSTPSNRPPPADRAHPAAGRGDRRGHRCRPHPGGQAHAEHRAAGRGEGHAAQDPRGAPALPVVA